MEETTTLGQFLKNERLARFLTMQEVADEVETTKSYIHDLEHDISVPGLYMAYKIALLYELDLFELASILDIK